MRFFSRWRPRPKPSVPQRSAAQIAYEADPRATASCSHLKPIERAMRDSGVAVRLLEISEFAPVVKAACRINEPALRRMFNLPASIYYREGYDPERTPYDNPRADIFCAECLQSDRAHSDILVLHPTECGPGTPWFPTPP